MITTSNFGTGRFVRSVAFASALGLVGARTASAQDTDVDPRWQAWLGCWQPTDPATSSQGALLCIVPASPRSAVDLVSLVDAKEVGRQRFDATGRRRAVLRDGCEGWESSQWSADDRRVYLRSELTCPGALERVSTGVMAMSPEGEWLDVQGVSAGGGTGIRVVRYRDAGVPTNLPAEIHDALADRATAIGAARVAAGSGIGTAEIVEAAQRLDAMVLQALLVERGQQFQLNAKQLMSLTRGGVPGSVTDVMVALSYPRTFTLNRMTPQRAVTGDSMNAASAYGSRGMMPGYLGNAACSRLSPGYAWGYDPWSLYPSQSGYGMYGMGRCGYGYSPYGYGFGYWRRTPYVIVGRGNGGPAVRGQAVNGRGYTRRGSGSAVRGTVGTSVRRSGGGSGGSTGHSGRSGRTAKPRP